MKISPMPTNRRLVLIVTLVLLLPLMTFVLQQPALLAAGTFGCAFYALACYRFSKFRNDQQLLLFLVGCALFLPGLINFSHGLSPYFYFFSTVATFFAAKASSRYPPEVFLAAFRIIFIAAVIAIAYGLYVYWGQPEPLGEIIPGSSTNGIPAYLIVVQIGLSLCNYLVLRQLPVLSPLITATVAVIGYGRGSLVVAALIIVASLFFNLLSIRSVSRLGKFSFLIFLVGMIVGLALEYEQIVELATNYTKLQMGLVDTNRLEIWDQYISKINAWTLLTGADYTGTVIESLYDGNPHISYIRTHALFGLPVTLLALLSPFFPFFVRKAWSARLVFASFIGLAAMRAASEPIFFPTLLDFFYFLNFFLFFRYAPERRSAQAGLNRNIVST